MPLEGLARSPPCARRSSTSWKGDPSSHGDGSCLPVAMEAPLRSVHALGAALLVGVVSFATGCGSGSGQGDGDGGGAAVTVQAANGRVTIPETPKRIVSLSPTHTETLFAIGAGPQ